MRGALRYRGIAAIEGRCGQCGAVRYWSAADVSATRAVTQCAACDAQAVRWRWVAPCPECRTPAPVDPADVTTQATADVYCAQHGVRPVRATTVNGWRGVIIAILLAVLVRGFLVEAFKIPSSSMVPTLLIGDQIFVNKTAYGTRVPFTNWWPIPPHGVQRGDVAVFLYPVNPDLHFIKRVVGLPGDTIHVQGDTLSINGVVQPHTPIDGPDTTHYQYYQEQLDDVTHVVRYVRGAQHVNQTFVVPPDTFFAMGDNRDNSLDSRAWGPVPFANLSGKAMLIWLPRRCEELAGGLPDAVSCSGMRWERFGLWVD